MLHDGCMEEYGVFHISEMIQYYQIVYVQVEITERKESEGFFYHAWLQLCKT